MRSGGHKNEQPPYDLRLGLGQNVPYELLRASFLAWILNSQTGLLASRKQVASALIVIVFIVVVVTTVIVVIMLM